MARRGGRKTLEEALRGGEMRRIPYRITIEGSHYAADHPELRSLLRDAIVDAANEVPGASRLYIGTRHTEQPWSNKNTPKVTVGTKAHAPRRKGEVGPRPSVGKEDAHRKAQRQVAALLGNRARRGWSDTETATRIAQHGLWDAAVEMGVVEGPAPDVEAVEARNGTEPPRPRKRRVPRGLTIVETLPNGTRILSDGSRLTPKGRHLSADAVKQLQARATAARASRHRLTEIESSFPQPPEVTQVSPQEEPVQEPRPQPEAPPQALAPRNDAPRSFEQLPRKGGGVIRRVLSWRSDDPPRIVDVPPLTTEEWWDHLILAYQHPDTDTEALCRNNHITREALNHELERRGMRPYAHPVVTETNKAAPPRLF